MLHYDNFNLIIIASYYACNSCTAVLKNAYTKLPGSDQVHQISYQRRPVT